MRYVAALFILIAMPARGSAQYAEPAALALQSSRGLDPPPAVHGDKPAGSAHAFSVARRSAVIDSSSGHGSQQTLAGLVIGMSVGVGATFFLVKHCERTSTRNEGPPCAVGYVVLGVPIVVASGLIGALIGSRQGKSNGIIRSAAHSTYQDSLR